MSRANTTGETLARTPSGARATTIGVHCFERKFEGEASRPPVSLVVFDCDETLTLSTFMPKEKEFERNIGWSSWPEYISMVNFGTPFIEENRDFEKPFGEGSRLLQLQHLFYSLTCQEGQPRTLAILTRNSRGAVACLNLLMMAKLAEYFSVIWSMSTHPGMSNGVYREGAAWKTFRAPLNTIYDHKADVLDSVAQQPTQWFPQLAANAGNGGAEYSHLSDLKLENIVLVDDVRTNFQSPSPSEPKVLRYCKVARYDAKHPQMGFLADMGGIGAKRGEDYATLLSFVQEPWKFKEEPHVICIERHFEGCEVFPPVSVVIFEFDETLSLFTYLPDEEPEIMKEIGYSGNSDEARDHLVQYNFESTYIEGSRLEKLRTLLQDLSTSESRSPRSLAILTENVAGAVAVLNLLLMADLADYFCAIWAPMAEDGLPKCVCKRESAWEEFTPPAEAKRDQDSKGDMLASIVARPREWFPEAFEETGQVKEGLEHLAPENFRLENIVLIDDERTKFHTSSGDSLQVLRYCKVARYDDIYRDQGLMMHMGGIGARSEKDYRLLRYFVDRPWKSRVDDDPVLPQLHPPEDLEHNIPEVELPKNVCFRRQNLSRAKTAPAGEL
eukprot:CAMPEP_0113822738 /NCGR_PEP_ID=MMETSP0328-20130328/2393_1 /TAXON_ID=39455 /ORGANISM="Alexandrium minutum" /LENGTH=612 /DNA_ID=CAMNT_0000790679 /DNA_START=29 /DNA_END=1863 /DNA_ORIENTATION=- /assembly_acc=CAM_ASM_000350